MSLANYIKDPSSTLDYSINWSKWLKADTIVTSEWTVPPGITQESDSHTSQIATIWISGGTLGNSYDLVNHVTTAAGREEERTITITVRER